MARELSVPTLGMDMQEATIVRWLVCEGDEVQKGEPVLEIDTDKTTFEVEAPESGTLSNLTGKEGETLPVGAFLAYVLAPGEEVPQKEGEDKEEGHQEEGQQNEQEEEGSLVPDASPEIPPDEPLSPEPGAPVPEEVSPEEVSPEEVSSAGSGPSAEAGLSEDGSGAVGGPASAPSVPPPAAGKGLRASPAARRLAAERGVDISSVAGSGPAGRVYLSDVLAFEATTTAPAATPEQGEQEEQEVSREELPSREASPKATSREGAAAGAATSSGVAAEVLEEGIRREPLTQVRRIGAKRTQRSFSEVPHFYLRREMDAGALVLLRERLKEKLGERPEAVGVVPSLNDLVAFAVSRTLADHPRLRARFDEERGELVVHERVNLGIAAATERGLVVPVVRDAGSLRLLELAKRTRELLGKAREGKLAREELSGGTFTISNLGMMGIDSFDAIVNQPEAAILAVGQLRTVPRWNGGTWVPKEVISMTLSVDHRVADGADGARFLADLQDGLSNWELLI
ncbi:Pyruvate/2-oxoglutarate dehydrogenase complex dihydrolipoamide acyltransferase (E2) component [Rubrobacter radiotolerans]|uniref:Dihydrolipoamide acetyltransferase component of pyruvate dehydrogenase complex n=1 Tax=Rubrobacter radiotolerans TaxID=42256 RepID=A0A023X6R3_RUBRA|nr:Pyruvate/2-oxoglutarate dehydrogenase complex dihydrolipoamide acyltransferase (E2) component [Rubrobacter radiotolerans]SMC07689.1 pyruvate dehydrogenase E2 component (dihydrolipoamide acetyltransferase) [Rubrobacter radiotolerans DSM 5868]